VSVQPAFRMTAQRRVILRELKRVVTHPTADEIYLMVRKIIPRISLGTVYRNLEILTDMELVQKIECAGNQRRYDGNPDPHHHIRCIRCGRVGDVEDDVIENFSFSAEKIPSWEVRDHRVIFLGICPPCRTECAGESGNETEGLRVLRK